MTENSQVEMRPRGNLRQDLIDAGVQLLAEGGLPALTLRKCALRVGVSHAAPAHHFDGKRGLLTAIVSHGFSVFGDFMIAERDASPPDPKSRLIGICRGYLKFSAAYSGLAELMFMTGNLDTDLPQFQKQASRSYQILAKGCEPFKSVPGPEQLETLIWSMVQGYAHLSRNNQVDPAAVPFETIISMIHLEIK